MFLLQFVVFRVTFLFIFDVLLVFMWILMCVVHVFVRFVMSFERVSFDVDLKCVGLMFIFFL